MFKVGSVVGDSGDGEIGNLLKVKNIKNFAKFKKPAKNKANKAFKTSFFIPKAKIAFIQLRKAFIKVPIFCHSNLKYDIWIKTNASSYTISGIFSEITLDWLFSNNMTLENIDPKFSKSKIGQYYPIIVFFKKMILIEIKYKTHNPEFLAIVKAFQNWCHYLEGCKYKIFV